MTDNWKTYTLGEVLEIKYGKDHKPLSDGDIPVYGSGGIMRYVNKALYDQPTILIPRKGTLSNLFFVERPFWSVDTMFYTKIREGNNPKFIYYYLKTLNLAALNVGSAVPSLTTEVLNKVEIQLPDVEVQNQIVTILSSLDDKIELNNQMNQTLEAMAQAIFKEWFLDFNFPGFDGELVNGLPKGWRMGKISDIADVGSSKRIFRDEYRSDGIPFFRGKEITQLSNNKTFINEFFISKEKYLELKEKFEVPKFGDLLITSVGTIGSVWFVDNEMPFYFKDGNVTWIKNYLEEYFKYYVFEWFKTDGAKEQIIRLTIGSTQKALTISSLKNVELVIPDVNTLQKFNTLLESISIKRILNVKDIETLTQLRDSLLPKLMNAKIEVKL